MMDAFARYLPQSHDESKTSATPTTEQPWPPSQEELDREHGCPRESPPQCVNVSETQQPRAFSSKINVSDTPITDTLKNAENPHGMGITDTLTHREGDFRQNESEPDPDGWFCHDDDVTSTMQRDDIS